MTAKPYFRFSWSHEAALHRMLSRTFYALMRFVPFSVKYGIGMKLRRNKPPYSLVKNGSVVVQVGAPRDTLQAGHSRAMYFSLLAGPNGKVIILEPNRESIEAFEAILKRLNIRNVILRPVGAWSEKKVLKVFIDDAHPACSFSEGSKQYDATRMQSFRAVDVPADTIDNIMAENNLKHVDLISITTNGAEREILVGLRRTISAGLPYISLARTGSNYEEMMESFGFRLYAHDDRGFTFEQRA